MTTNTMPHEHASIQTWHAWLCHGADAQAGEEIYKVRLDYVGRPDDDDLAAAFDAAFFGA